MPNPLGPSDFFALEAGEYLERLARLAAADGGPPSEEFVRYARALRGSALMANQPEITRAAGALEGVARAFHERAFAWDAALAEVIGQSIDDLKHLVRQARDWSADDSAKAQRLSQALEEISGRPPEGSRPAARSRGELNAGVRAFVAREGALVASALDRAARALAADATARDPLHNILRRMQSLRGLAALSDLAPLPELLDSLEMAVGQLLRAATPPAGLSEVFDAAAKALTRASRDVADQGGPARDAPETRHFAVLMIRRLADDRDVVGIETLAPTGEPSIVTQGTPPDQAAPVALGSAELLTHGEFLVHAAEGIELAETDTLRDLRLFSLTGALDSPRLAAAASIGHSLETFSRAVRMAIVTGTAAGDPAGFAAALRSAGALIRGLGPRSDPELASTELAGLAAVLGQAPDDIVPIESLAPDDDAIPVADLAPDAEAGEASTGLTEDASLAGSFLTFARLSGARGGRTSANGGGAARTSAPPQAPPAPAAAAEAAAVEIDSLLYRGEAALQRADVVRRDLAGLLRGGAELQRIRPLLDELLDLVPLALEPSA